MKEDPDSLSGSSVVSGHMLIGMSAIYEQRSELAGMSPAEFALITASMRQARGAVEGLLRRTDELTATVDSRYRQAAQGDPTARRVRGARRESC